MDFSYPLAMVVGGGFGLAGHEVLGHGARNRARLGKNHGREHRIDSVVAGSPSPRKRPTSRLHALGARARAVVSSAVSALLLFGNRNKPQIDEILIAIVHALIRANS